MDTKNPETGGAVTAAAAPSTPILCTCWDVVRPAFWKAGDYRRGGYETMSRPPVEAELPKAKLLRTTLIKPAETLAATGPERVQGRWVEHVRWNLGLGPSGVMNFIGFKLAPKDPFPGEWLVLAIQNAGEYLICDGVRVAEPPDVEGKRRPLIRAYGDEINPRFAASVLQTLHCKERFCRLAVNHDGKINSLEFPETVNRLPPLEGGRPRPHLGPGETIAQGWVLSRYGFLLAKPPEE